MRKTILVLVMLFAVSIFANNQRPVAKAIPTVNYGIDGTKTEYRYIPFKRTVPKNAKLTIPFKRF